MYRIETHLHTTYISHCGWLGAQAIMKYYSACGYDAICVTDHYNRECFDYADIDLTTPGSKTQAFLLGFQAVAFRLGGRGNTGINVTFLFHILTSFGCSLSHGSPCMINISESGIPANSQDAQGFALKTMRNAQKKPTAQMTAGKDVVSCLFRVRILYPF